jgi:hypothetical protein
MFWTRRAGLSRRHWQAQAAPGQPVQSAGQPVSRGADAPSPPSVAGTRAAGRGLLMRPVEQPAPFRCDRVRVAWSCYRLRESAFAV